MFAAGLETDEVGRKDYGLDEGDECARVLARYIPAVPSPPPIQDKPMERR
jgi:hypothetical protein